MSWSFYYNASRIQSESLSRAAANDYRFFSNSNTWGTPPCPECGAHEITQQHVCELSLPEIQYRRRRYL